MPERADRISSKNFEPAHISLSQINGMALVCDFDQKGVAEPGVSAFGAELPHP